MRANMAKPMKLPPSLLELDPEDADDVSDEVSESEPIEEEVVLDPQLFSEFQEFPLSHTHWSSDFRYEVPGNFSWQSCGLQNWTKDVHSEASFALWESMSELYEFTAERYCHTWKLYALTDDWLYSSTKDFCTFNRDSRLSSSVFFRAMSDSIDSMEENEPESQIYDPSRSVDAHQDLSWESMDPYERIF